MVFLAELTSLEGTSSSSGKEIAREALGEKKGNLKSRR